MKIAICSQTGQRVDQCFGHSQKFYIYHLEGRDLHFECMRVVEPYFSVPEVFTQFDARRFSEVYEVIEDCSQVYCVAVDQIVKEKLAEREMEVKISHQTLKEIFNDLKSTRRKKHGKTRLSHLCM